MLGEASAPQKPFSSVAESHLGTAHFISFPDLARTISDRHLIISPFLELRDHVARADTQTSQPSNHRRVTPQSPVGPLVCFRPWSRTGSTPPTVFGCAPWRNRRRRGSTAEKRSGSRPALSFYHKAARPVRPSPLGVSYMAGC